VKKNQRFIFIALNCQVHGEFMFKKTPFLRIFDAIFSPGTSTVKGTPTNEEAKGASGRAADQTWWKIGL